MFKPLMVAILACTAMTSAASAATLQTLGDGTKLNDGTNSLSEMIFSAGTQAANTTVFGVTNITNTGISFTSTSTMAINGSGYAQFFDADTDTTPWNNLQIFLTSSPDGFTAYEFTIQYSSKLVPGSLTIGYDLVGGGSGAFSPISFSNSAARDFQLIAGSGLTFSKIYLTSDVAFDQIKQNDIDLAGPATGVPEPTSWAMMIAGFGLVGFSLRRSHRSARSIAA